LSQDSLLYTKKVVGNFVFRSRRRSEDFEGQTSYVITSLQPGSCRGQCTAFVLSYVLKDVFSLRPHCMHSKTMCRCGAEDMGLTHPGQHLLVSIICSFFRLQKRFLDEIRNGSNIPFVIVVFLRELSFRQPFTRSSREYRRFKNAREMKRQRS